MKGLVVAFLVGAVTATSPPAPGFNRWEIQDCGRNEQFAECYSSSCKEALCSNGGRAPGPMCTMDCRQGCVCKSGFARQADADGGGCVSVSDCGGDGGGEDNDRADVCKRCVSTSMAWMQGQDDCLDVKNCRMMAMQIMDDGPECYTTVAKCNELCPTSDQRRYVDGECYKTCQYNPMDGGPVTGGGIIQLPGDNVSIGGGVIRPGGGVISIGGGKVKPGRRILRSISQDNNGCGSDETCEFLESGAFFVTGVCVSQEPLTEGDICMSGGVESGPGVQRYDDCPEGTSCQDSGMMAIGGESPSICKADGGGDINSPSYCDQWSTGPDPWKACSMNGCEYDMKARLCCPESGCESGGGGDCNAETMAMTRDLRQYDPPKFKYVSASNACEPVVSGSGSWGSLGFDTMADCAGSCVDDSVSDCEFTAMCDQPPQPCEGATWVVDSSDPCVVGCGTWDESTCKVAEGLCDYEGLRMTKDLRQYKPALWKHDDGECVAIERGSGSWAEYAFDTQSACEDECTCIGREKADSWGCPMARCMAPPAKCKYSSNPPLYKSGDQCCERQCYYVLMDEYLPAGMDPNTPCEEALKEIGGGCEGDECCEGPDPPRNPNQWGCPMAMCMEPDERCESPGRQGYSTPMYWEGNGCCEKMCYTILKEEFRLPGMDPLMRCDDAIKELPAVEDKRCADKKCGDSCANSAGMMMVMQYCQPDGSCASNADSSACPSDNDCPAGIEIVNCFMDPCQTASCDSYPDAECRSNYCGGCNADFYMNGSMVDCEDKMYNCMTKEMWSDKKTEWCCANQNAGCPEESYNCRTREMWTEEKTEWCCANMDLGCPDDGGDDKCANSEFNGMTQKKVKKATKVLKKANKKITKLNKKIKKANKKGKSTTKLENQLQKAEDSKVAGNAAQWYLDNCM